MVDKLYSNWVDQCPEFQTDFGPLTNDYVLEPFPRTIAQVVNTTLNGYCYGYTQSRGDSPRINSQCPSVAGNGTISTINDAWLEMSIQILVPGVNNMRVAPKVNNLTEIQLTTVNTNRTQPTGPATTGGTNTGRLSRRTFPPQTIGNNRINKLPQYLLSSNMNSASSSINQENQDLRYAMELQPDDMSGMMLDYDSYIEIRNFDQLVVDDCNNDSNCHSEASLKNFNEYGR